ncbi:MAG: hypothetical protein L6R36_008598 [Xanthoria steineri]|nr:MAG: hypothetical protein L6R36_008598 [Xanthoria steineri]
MAAPTPEQIRYQLQHIQDDRSDEIITALGICLAFAIITVLLRFVARHLTRAPLGADDWTILFGLVCAIGHETAQAVCISYGLGRHTVVVKKPLPYARAINASIIFYLVSLGATKISILLLYRRIFPNREFHAVIWGMGVFVVAFTIASVLSMIFACKPISGAWNPFIKAKCINTEASILAVACMTIVSNFVILGLPLPIVWKLQLPTIRKFQLTLVFSLGTFASVISIYRATVISHVDKSDLSYNSTNRAIWSGVECCSAIVCANLATLRPVLHYLFTGNALSTGKTGTNSRATGSGTGTKSWRRWTWRQHAVASLQASKVSNDGTFHRLEQHPGTQSTDDVERQKFESYMMSPISSPKMPKTAHF